MSVLAGLVLGALQILSSILQQSLDDVADLELAQVGVGLQDKRTERSRGADETAARVLAEQLSRTWPQPTKRMGWPVT
jgi:hypothetical protein